MLEALSKKKIPIFWLGVFLIVWMISYADSYLHQEDSLQRIEARIASLELQMYTRGIVQDE
jgi:hypothetical protein